MFLGSLNRKGLVIVIAGCERRRSCGRDFKVVFDSVGGTGDVESGAGPADVVSHGPLVGRKVVKLFYKLERLADRDLGREKSREVCRVAHCEASSALANFSSSRMR